jgi:hypothetical protein
MDPMRVDPEMLRAIQDCSPDAPPVIFGHYWLPATAPKAALAPKITCLDFSSGLEGHFVACRWVGEAPIDASSSVLKSPP